MSVRCAASPSEQGYQPLASVTGGPVPPARMTGRARVGNTDLAMALLTHCAGTPPGSRASPTTHHLPYTLRDMSSTATTQLPRRSPWVKVPVP